MYETRTGILLGSDCYSFFPSPFLQDTPKSLARHHPDSSFLDIVAVDKNVFECWSCDGYRLFSPSSLLAALRCTGIAFVLASHLFVFCLLIMLIGRWQVGIIGWLIDWFIHSAREYGIPYSVCRPNDWMTRLVIFISPPYKRCVRASSDESFRIPHLLPP